MTQPRKWPTHLFRLRRLCAALDYDVDDLTIALGYVASPYIDEDPPENLAAARAVVDEMQAKIVEIDALLAEVRP